jgi:hypothetical protein
MNADPQPCFLDGGEDDYSPNMMSCGDCDFETHYESELFLHLKIHMGKEDEVCFFFKIF